MCMGIEAMLQPNRSTSRKNSFSGNKFFWVIQNKYLPLECINKLNKRKNAKQISAFDFSALYINIPHDELLDIS